MNPFRRKPLTTGRKAAAVIVALFADGLQLLLAPVPLADQVIDAAAMLIESWLIGFHPLLLPTFVVELIPLADLMPTWTGCVFAVLVLRRNEPPVVDIEAERIAPPALPPGPHSPRT